MKASKPRKTPRKRAKSNNYASYPPLRRAHTVQGLRELTPEPEDSDCDVRARVDPETTSANWDVQSRRYKFTIELTSSKPFSVKDVEQQIFADSKMSLALAVKVGPFRFMDLPTELRFTIYNILGPLERKSLHFIGNSQVGAKYVDRNRSGVNVLTKLMQTNRELQREVSHWLHGSFTFHFDDLNILSLFLKKQRTRPAVSKFDHLRKITVDLKRIGHQCPNRDQCDWAFEALCRCQNLKKLCFEICCAKHAIDAIKRRFFNPLIGLCEIREINGGEHDPFLSFIDFKSRSLWTGCARPSRPDPNIPFKVDQKECNEVKDWLVHEYAKFMRAVE